MIKRSLFLGASALLLLVVTSGTAMPQGAPPANQANEAPVPYTMTLGDMMNTLVQPRHAKLGLAGRAQNWPLAEYSLIEIRQVFAGIVKAQPRFRGLPVGELVGAAVSQPMNAVEAAIKQQDPVKFAAAYAQLTQGCNACHAAVEHPFVVIKVPDASAFPNQAFSLHR
ncbi:MAG: hypothetical protein WA280_12705 [Xanthobacteraceae bacterium]